MSDCQLPHILLGAGGHAKVLLSLARALGLEVMGVCDPELARQGAAEWRGVRILGDDTALDLIDPGSVVLINGIGQLVRGSLRQTVHQTMRHKGFHFATLLHPAAWVDRDVLLGEGVQVMAGVVIQAGSSIGESCIVNTNASIDHDCFLSKHIHVAPGATICGGVKIEEDAFIGAGATIIQGLTIGARAVVGAGAVVIRDVKPGQTRISDVCSL